MSSIGQSHSKSLTEPLPLLYYPNEWKQTNHSAREAGDRQKVQEKTTANDYTQDKKSDRQFLIKEIMRFHARLIDVSELAPNYPGPVSHNEVTARS
jgi:hypothetical protein